MGEFKESGCPACSAEVGTGANQPPGRMRCPQCGTELWYVAGDHTTHLLIRGDLNALERLAPKMDSLEVVDIVLAWEEDEHD